MTKKCFIVIGEDQGIRVYARNTRDAIKAAVQSGLKYNDDTLIEILEIKYLQRCWGKDIKEESSNEA